MDAIPQTCTVRARNTTAFDGGRAQELLLHAGAAYCNASAIQDWTCRPCLDPNFVPVEVVLDPDLYLQVSRTEIGMVGAVVWGRRGSERRFQGSSAIGLLI